MTNPTARGAWLLTHPSGIHGISMHRDLRDAALSFSKALQQKGFDDRAIFDVTVRELPSLRVVAAP